MQTFISYCVAYSLWFVAILLTGFGILVMRTAITQWYIVLEWLPTGLRAIDRLFIYIAGAVWVFLIFYLEGYLRAGAANGELTVRARRVYIWIALWLGLGTLLYATVFLYARWFV